MIYTYNPETIWEEISHLKSRDFVDLECPVCHKIFQIEKRKIRIKLNDHIKMTYCSYKCSKRCQYTSIKCNCGICGKEVWRRPSVFKRNNSSNAFCSTKCASIYGHNFCKSPGTNRSKLEQFIGKELLQKYTFEIQFNRKDTINSELDIYIPSLQLAFELNGIFHYEPIFGKEKLERTQNNDNRKFQACLEKGIELCIIDTSSIRYLKKSSAQKYLKIVLDIIEQKLKNESGEISPDSQ